MWKKLTSFVLGLVYFILLTPGACRANRMGSSNYNFTFTNINSGGGTTSSPNYTLDISLGQAAAKRWAENGYIIRAGFQYVHILYPFSFTLSDTSLNFETLVPNIAKTEQLTATVTHRGQGYEVKVYEDHPLQTFDASAQIPDTACDGPACTATQAQPWTSSSTTGFGYNVSGHDVAADFLGPTYFRPFSTNPATFMSSNEASRNRQSVITAKINIDGAQAAGTYQTVLRFIALPKY